jgi:hypothetical protein
MTLQASDSSHNGECLADRSKFGKSRVAGWSECRGRPKGMSKTGQT